MRRKKAPVVAIDNNPDFPIVPYVPIFRACCISPQKFTALSDALLGVWTHYYARKTIPCTGDEGNCVCTSQIIGRRWYGYVGVWEPRHCRVGLVEITCDAYRLNPKLHPSEGYPLRGATLKVYRIGNRPNSPMRCDIENPDPNAAELPAGPNVLESLMRIWGYPVDR